MLLIINYQLSNEALYDECIKGIPRVNGGMYVLYGHTYSKSMDQPGKVANPARGRLNRKNEYKDRSISPVPLFPTLSHRNLEHEDLTRVPTLLI